MQTEQELLKEIARVAGLINRKKHEQAQSKPTATDTSAHPAALSFARTVTQKPPYYAPRPPKIKSNMTYIRPTAQSQPSKGEKPSPATNDEIIPANSSSATPSPNGDTNNNSKRVIFLKLN